jgi:uncharacterized protein (TIGR03000 family)
MWRDLAVATPRAVGVFFLLVALTEPVESPALGAGRPPPDRAQLVVRLPASANLIVAGTSANLGGAERVLTSPVVGKGKAYVFRLTATWNDGSTPRKIVRNVSVKAGTSQVVNLAGAAVTAGKAAAKTIVAKPAPKAPSKAAAKVATLGGPKKRAFEFTYAATITGLEPGQKARIWLPVPFSNADQDVTVRSRNVPTASRTTTEPTYGNQLLYVDAAGDDAGKVALEMVYQVTRREVRAESTRELDDNADRLRRYLQPDALVPIDGKPLELIKDRDLPPDQKGTARVLYDVVNGNLRYSKEGTGWGRGDATWACENRRGNCTDFHSLFIALARSQKIPAKFEIGFSLPQQHGAGTIDGYHCWAKFKPDNQAWLPVDVAEANKNPQLKDYYFGNLSENRVAFSTGRDIVFEPPQDGPPVNFLIYPYVEVARKIYPREKVMTRFSFKDE